MKIKFGLIIKKDEVSEVEFREFADKLSVWLIEEGLELVEIKVISVK